MSARGYITGPDGQISGGYNEGPEKVERTG